MAGSKEQLRQSLQFRLSVWLVALTLAVAVLAGSFSFVAAFDDANELQDDLLRQIAALVDHNHLPTGGVAQVDAGSDSDPEDRVVLQLLPAAGDAIAARPKGELLLPAGLPDGLQTVEVGGESWRIFVRRLAGEQRIAVGQQTAVRDEIAGDSAFRTVLPFVILTPILLIVLADLIRRMFKPLTQLAVDLDSRTEQDLGTLSATGLPTEIRPFVVAINRMLVRVAQSVGQQRRFVADAAHELRSPLTALSLQAERLGAAEMSAEARQRLSALRHGMERTKVLLDQLLTLARAQEYSQAPASPISVQKVFRQIIENLLPQGEAKAIDLGIGCDDDARLAVAEVDLMTLVGNLAENAIKYTPRGGRVDLAVAVRGDCITLQVEDSGPGIAPEHREAVFEPFHRLLEGDEAGSGLGLAIVKAIADRYRADVTLDYADAAQSRGLRVSVEFCTGRRAVAQS